LSSDGQDFRQGDQHPPPRQPSSSGKTAQVPVPLPS
jgi:hypothetical protein